MKLSTTTSVTTKQTIKDNYDIQKGKKILLKEKSINHIIDLDSITHLVCDCYLTTVYMVTGEKYIVSKLLKEFEIELIDYCFVRVNRNTIINTSHVLSYGKGKCREVCISNNVIINVSRRGMARLKGVIEYVNL